MHFVVFGLCISSSWGNGHATLWRGLIKALVRRGHTITFYEKDVPYYASTRDGWIAPRGTNLRLYQHFGDIRDDANRELQHTDLAIVTSYCPDGISASALVLDSAASIKTFYDLDTPVTLDSLSSGLDVSYIPMDGLARFDLVLSYTGGRAIDELKIRLGARNVAPLYGWVDTETHSPAVPVDEFRSELCYLGTYAKDRQDALEKFFISATRVRPEKRFALGGAQYPEDFPWTPNIFFVRHLPPSLHPAFFCSARATLNVTRQAMAQYGYCPSGRLFEAAACGVPMLTDWWEGLNTFFEPGTQILPVHQTKDVLEALSLNDSELRRIASAARERVMENHTADARAIELEALIESAARYVVEPALIA
jgi:spore maturation protein CgeB